MPYSVDELENIKNKWLRLIPWINQQQDFFGSLGNQERRIVNRRENQLNDSVGYNELTSDDLQDIIDTQQD